MLKCVARGEYGKPHSNSGTSEVSCDLTEVRRVRDSTQMTRRGLNVLEVTRRLRKCHVWLGFSRTLAQSSSLRLYCVLFQQGSRLSAFRAGSTFHNWCTLAEAVRSARGLHRLHTTLAGKLSRQRRPEKPEAVVECVAGKHSLLAYSRSQ